MKHFKNPHFFLLKSAAVFVLLFSVFSCSQFIDDTPEVNNNSPVTSAKDSAPEALFGIWQGQYPGEEYTITYKEFKSTGSYEGKNLRIKKLNDQSGYIYIQYTKSMRPDYSYATTAPDVGKWYAIHYKELTETTVKLSAAWGNKSSCATLEEAVSEFTVEKGYFAAYSTCTKTGPAPAEVYEIFLQETSLNNTSWFVGDTRIDFPEVDEALYLNYYEDGLKTNRWIKLTAKGNTLYQAEIIWSENIREIGKKSSVDIGKDSSNKLVIRSDILNLSGLETYEGVTASAFDISKVPALPAEYNSKFAGTYTLSSTHYTLTINAKLGISADVNHYWNANVLSSTYNEETKTYDLMLAHTSQNGAAGSISPGITGHEPFINTQGLFWTHLTLTYNDNRQWIIKWNSEWKNSPYEALNASLDMEDTFTGPSNDKIRYTYKFYFGTPAKDSAGWCCVDKGELIHTVTFESYIPVTKTWSQIYTENGIAAKVAAKTIPEDKLTDYWWYSTNSITSIENSYVYKLTDSWNTSLEEYEFYLALKDRPANNGTVFIPEGEYTGSGDTWSAYSLTVSGNHCVLTYPDGQKEFDVVPDMVNNPNSQDFPDENYPNIRVFYNVTGKYRVKLYKTAKSSTTLVEWPK